MDTWLRMLLKLPAVLADFGLAACVAWILREKPVWAGIGAVAVLLHPATWYVSAWWGQYESIYVLAALLAVLFAVGGRDGLAAAAVAVAVLTKPQALPFLVPFAAWFLARGGIGGLAPRHRDRSWPSQSSCGCRSSPQAGRCATCGNLGEYQNDIFSVLSLRAWNFWWIVQDVAGGRRVRVGSRVDHRPDLVPASDIVVTGLLGARTSPFGSPRPAAPDARPRPRCDHARGLHVPDHDARALRVRRVVFLMLLIPEARDPLAGHRFRRRVHAQPRRGRSQRRRRSATCCRSGGPLGHRRLDRHGGPDRRSRCGLWREPSLERWRSGRRERRRSLRQSGDLARSQAAPSRHGATASPMTTSGVEERNGQRQDRRDGPADRRGPGVPSRRSRTASPARPPEPRTTPRLVGGGSTGRAGSVGRGSGCARRCRSRRSRGGWTRRSRRRGRAATAGAAATTTRATMTSASWRGRKTSGTAA